MDNLKQYKDLHKLFAETEYGQELQSSIRFKKYNLSKMPYEDWEKLLGRDVNNLEHMSLTHGIAVAFIRYSEQHQPDLLSDEEKRLLLLTAIMHDWGEAINGDKSYGDKTPAEEALEREDFGTVLGTVSYGDFTNQEMDQARAIAFDHTKTKLGRLFFAIERLGYMRTAINASKIVRAQPQPDDTTDGLIWLVADVLSNQMHDIELIKDSYEYDAVHTAFSSYKDQIEEAFELALRHPIAFENYGEKANDKFLSVSLARTQWNTFKSTLS